MNEATVCFFLLTSLVYFAKAQSRGYQRMLGESALRKYCSEDGEECMFSIHCCPGLYCALQGNIGTCLTHESALTRCLSDADCPETKCCHRQRSRGGFGACAYVCEGNEVLVDVPSNVPVGSYRGDDFWNYWVHKRRFRAPLQRYLRRRW